MKLNKLLLSIISIALFSFDVISLVIWLSETKNIINDLKVFINYIMSNIFSLVIFADLIMFSIITIIWMFYDSRKRKFKLQNRIILLISVLIIGFPVLLMYLALRKKDE
ncbi:MAG: DUF2834 domain-containing protein [Ignavibacteriae bacterium]|nr:DUF2834 domain-containing protein [Ignavibacteriota bacterium]